MNAGPGGPAERRGDVARRAVLVIIPTTAGPILIRSLLPRAGLPASAAFADGDYRPLPWSGDYARLSAAGGPLSRVLGHDEPPHELRLSGSFDTGRSWEVPVCLAYALLEEGWTLTADVAAADLMLWSTGAVDLDGNVRAGDYALLDKLASSSALLETAPGIRVAALLPAGPDRDEAERAWRVTRPSNLTILPSSSVSAAAEALLSRDGPPAAGRNRRSRAGIVAAACVAALLAGGALLAFGDRNPGADIPAADPVATPAAPVRPAEASRPPSATPEVAPPTPEPVAPPFTVEEITASPGSSCRRVVFGADTALRRPVLPETEGRLRPSRLEPNLCGLAFRSSDPTREVEIGPELRAASVPPVRLADGAQAYFLREGGRQELVYAIRSRPSGNTLPARFTHALVR